VFLKERPDGTGGVLARDGYFAYSLTGAIIIFVTIVASVLGTAHRIPYLAEPPKRTVTLKGMAVEIFHTLNNRSFIAMALASMFVAIGVGARNGLEIYFGLYFWELKQVQLAGLATMSVIGGFIGVFLAPFVSRWLGKKWGTVATFMAAVCVHITPVSLRLLDLAPANGTPELLWLLYGEEIVNATLAANIAILLFALIADVVEDAEVKTGRRSEGLLLSANNLLRKSVTGGGVLAATTVLAFIGFPDKAERGQVDPEVLRNLGLAYIPLIVGFYSLAIALISTYTITRERHMENLERLRERAGEQAAAEAGPGIGSGEIAPEKA
jgi:Na+/melibiose symporter-like transporter